MGMDFRCGRVDVLERALNGLEFEWEAREVDGGLLAEAGGRVALAFVPHSADRDALWSMLTIDRNGAAEHMRTGSFADLVLELLTYGPVVPPRRAPEGVDVAELARRVVAMA